MVRLNKYKLGVLLIVFSALSHLKSILIKNNYNLDYIQ